MTIGCAVSAEFKAFLFRSSKSYSVIPLFCYSVQSS